MRKLCAIVFLLSMTGVAVSVFFIFVRYSPASVPGIVPYGSSLDYIRSPLSGFGKLPFASIDLFYYMLTASLALLVAVSGYISSIIVYSLFIVSLLSFAFRAAVSGFLIYDEIICMPFFYITAVNFINVIVFAGMNRAEKLRDCEVLQKTLDSATCTPSDSREKFLYFFGAVYTLLIALSAVLVTVSVSLYGGEKKSKSQLVQFMIEKFRSQSVEIKYLPETSLVYGKTSSPVKIAVISDPLCRSCIRLYRIEEELLKKYSDKVIFYHYLYPLDPKCNYRIESESVTGSCDAARIFIASAKIGLFGELLNFHAASSGRLSKILKNASNYESIFNELFPGKIGAKDFVLSASAKSTGARINRDIAFARSLDVKKLPTVFINGKRVSGSMTFEYLESLIMSVSGN